MELDDRVTIATPEGIELQLQLAGLGSRFIAGVTDLIIQIVLLVVLALITGAFSGGEALNATVYVIGAFLILFFYPIVFEMLTRGRTPGKRLTHLRVVRDTGAPDDLPASASPGLVVFAESRGFPVLGAQLTSRAAFPSTHPCWAGVIKPDFAWMHERFKHAQAIVLVGGRAFVAYPYSAERPTPDGVAFLHIADNAEAFGREHAADMAVLSIASGLTVWCRSAAAWLRAPGVPAQHWSYSDLVEVGEQAGPGLTYVGNGVDQTRAEAGQADRLISGRSRSSVAREGRRSGVATGPDRSAASRPRTPCRAG